MVCHEMTGDGSYRWWGKFMRQRRFWKWDRSGGHSGQGTDGELNTHQVRLDDLADPSVDGAVLTADTMGVAREVLV